MRRRKASDKDIEPSDKHSEASDKHSEASDLLILDGKQALFLEQLSGNVHGRGLPSVPSVFLEGKAKHGNFLARDSIEHRLNHLQHVISCNTP